MISKRAYPAAIKYNDILHIFGGYDYDQGILKSSETINPDGQAKVEKHFSFKLEPECRPGGTPANCSLGPPRENAEYANCR